MPLTIYNSSAGSGKTYTLTREYLNLLFRSSGNTYFTHVLAVTFTNDATAEMKERILKALREISEGGMIDLVDYLSSKNNLDATQVRLKASEIYKQLLNRYSDFHVSTIDSFFQRILKGFGREIGLQHGYGVEMDLDHVLDYAVEQLLACSGKDKVLTEWMTDLLNEMMDDGKGWDLEAGLKKLGKELFREQFKLIEELVFTEDFDSRLQQLRKDLNDFIKNYESGLDKLAGEALKTAESKGFTDDDFVRKKTGPLGFFRNAINKRSHQPNSYVSKMLEENAGWGHKESPQYRQAEAFGQEYLYQAILRICDYVDSQGPLYVGALLVRKNLYTFGLLHALAGFIRKYRTENEVLLISDTAALLDKITGNNDTPFIFEKAGNRFHHFLIDEFQDTSGFQWRNFLPLLVNSLSTNKSNIIVGDVKQSIYRFRGGDWKLLLDQVESDMSAFPLKPENLKVNYRSHRTVVDFNNMLFRTLPGMLDQHLLSELPGGAAFFDRAYEQAAQDLPEAKVKEGGFVRVQFLNADEEDFVDLSLARLPKLVEDLQNRGFRARDIVFLVKKNQEGSMIAEYLNRYKTENPDSPYNWEIVSSESLQLSASLSCNLLSTLAGVFSYPDNDLLKAEACLYLAALNDLDIQELMADKGIKRAFHELFPAEIKDEGRWLSMPLYDMIEELCILLELDKKPSESVYLRFYFDAVLGFLEKGHNTGSEFYTWWLEKGCSKPVLLSDKQDAMRIITYHKSKGLQFPVVIMPFVSWDMTHKGFQAPILWPAMPECEPFKSFPFLPVKYVQNLSESCFADSYREEMSLAMLDSLNVLYVGCTRAEKGLYLLAPEPKKEEKLNCISDFLYAALKNSFEDPDDKVYKNGDLPAVQPFSYEKRGTADLIPVVRWKSRARISRKSEEFFREIDSGITRKINYGLLVHEVLARISSHKEISEVLLKMRLEGLINENEELELKRKLEGLFLSDRMKTWFSEKYESINESEIWMPGKNSFRPDKVLFDSEHTIVLDFKSGKEAEEHSRQVQQYLDIISEMGYKDPQGFLVYLEDFNIKPVTL